MPLQTTMTTSLTGMTAAETMIDVAGNNIANANTVGFKESSVNFATQFLQTYSIGSAPNANNGGTNPRQVGLGVQVAEISPDFTQGTVEISSNPLDLAIQGDGFFIVQGSQGEQLYTRNGQFKTNANNEIVTISGQRVLGYTVDDNYNLIPELAPLTIPLGAAAVAQATENVKLKGQLDPNAEVGTVAQEIQSGILSDGRKAVPPGADIDLTSLAVPIVDAMTVAPDATPGSVAADTYQYRIQFLDAYGNEGPASTTRSVNVSTGGQSVLLDDIPTPPTGMTQMRIYRSNSAAPNVFNAVTAGPIAANTQYLDSAADATIAPFNDLNTSGLSNGSYSYYVTWRNSTSGNESRPTALLGPTTTDAANSPRILLSDLPKPTNDPETGGYNEIRIYRNLAADQSDFRLVDTIDQSTIASFGADPVSYIDNTPDSGLGAETVNLDGPEITFDLPLVELVQRDGSNYVNLFEPGTLSFTATADHSESTLATRTFEIGDQTTLGQLIDFMEDTMGIVPSTSGGGTLVDNNRLQFTSNLGIENAVSVGLDAFKLTPASGGADRIIPLRFGATQEANGAGGSMSATVYDSLGSPLHVRVSTVLESRSEAGAVFRWTATSADTIPDTGDSIVVGTGTFTTGSDGKLVSVGEDQISLDRGDSPAESPLIIQLDFSQITALADNDSNPNNNNEISQGETDGSPAGTLTSFVITDSGSIQGVFSNGGTRDLGQIRMAQFSNNAGLEQLGENLFRGGVNSGLPIYGNPSSQGIGKVKAGAVELSNTDIGQNLIKLILASTQYRGAARVITTAQQLLDELLALRR
jgi:flagellar hook protein FlgE